MELILDARGNVKIEHWTKTTYTVIMLIYLANNIKDREQHGLPKGRKSTNQLKSYINIKLQNLSINLMATRAAETRVLS